MKNKYIKSLNSFAIAVLIVPTLLLSTPVVAVQLADGETAMLNMENTDINTLISTVADKTGKNFIVDPRVKGKVTIISHQAITRDELYQTFLSILEVHGFAAIPGDGVIKIVPDSTAKQSSIRTATSGAPGQGDELVTRVVMVDYVNAMQLVPILRPLIPQQGHMAAFPSSNVLIVSDRADNISRIMQLIKRIDRPSNDDIEVISLQHASAAEMVRILTSLKKRAPGKGAAAAPVLVADERTNSILLGGNKSERLRLRALIAHLDTATEDGGNTQVIYLKYADAASLVPVLTGVSANLGKSSGKPKSGGAGGASKIVIQADENTNALVITAQPDVMRSLQSVIRQLDIRRAQVLIEAIIAEVSTIKSAELGVQFTTFDGDNTGAIASEFPGSGPSILGLLGADSAADIVLGGGLNIGIGKQGSNPFGLLLRALASDNDSNLLSTPNLVMLDNEEAEIIVGQNVPFVTGSQSTAGGLATPFQTIQRQDVGLTLKVKPQINEGDAIKLEITQETSSVEPDNRNVTTSDIITNKRSIKTTVLANDGDIVVLGGLITDELTEGVSKIPVLGDIPLLGNLFRSRNTSKVKRNLMVFLHPVILKDGLGTRYASRKYNFIRGKQLEAKEDGVNLLDDSVAPVLPTLDEYLELPPAYEPEAKAAEQ